MSWRRAPGRLGLALGLGLALAAAPAAADNVLLDRAQRAIDDIDYQTASDLAEQALTAGGLDDAGLRRAHRLAGMSAAALGDAPRARAHFVRWLVLDPAAALPAGVSPKFGQPFTEAKAEAEKLGRFDVKVDVTRTADRVEVTLTAHDPLGMIAGMRLRLGDASEVSVDGTHAVLPAADAEQVGLAVVVIDASGNALARQSLAGTRGSHATVGSPGDEPHVTAPVTRSRRWPVIVRWPTWTGIALVAGGAGGYFAMQVGKDEDALTALNADSAAHTFDEAEALRDRGARHALYANVGFGVAGAAALAAVLAFALEPSGTVEVTPAPTAGGASVTASIRF